MDLGPPPPSVALKGEAAVASGPVPQEEASMHASGMAYEEVVDPSAGAKDSATEEEGARPVDPATLSVPQPKLTTKKVRSKAPKPSVQVLASPLAPASKKKKTTTTSLATSLSQPFPKES